MSGNKKGAGRRRTPSRAKQQPSERAGGADHTARPRAATAERIDKVAPWRQWTSVEVRASSAGACPVQFTVSGLGRSRNERYSELITAAAQKHFRIEEAPRKGEGPAAYLVEGRLRVVYNELIVQFEPRVPPARCSSILKEAGFREVERNRLVESKWIVRHARPGVAGKSLLVAADAFKRYKEVRFAWPNSVAEYVRANNPTVAARDWWLEKIGVNSGGSRVLDTGDPGVVIAVLDDGVDVAHFNLVSRVDAGLGRDYAVAVNQAGHTDPRPKIQVSDDEQSDYHGTACAGLVCSDGSEQQLLGVAPGCMLIPVRVIDGPALVNEGWVADAIEYATLHAHVISCSWTGTEHAAVVTALNDTAQGRGGKGVAVFCAAGNDGGSVAFPARHIGVIAIGACDHEDGQTDYANLGPELDVVAPSSNGVDVYTTDVSQPGWGYNTLAPGGAFYNGFGGTSAATAIAAGVGALCFSANPGLRADELRSVLQDTAVKIAKKSYIVYVAGHSKQFGYGRINAAAAVIKAKAMPPS
jgi:thermitase